ncbi:hypothetical protein DAEQUDRAFT_683936 [Daedalea quercina L-15889]|uniref:Uncharacterized protein n=1 Tax=Daedalea quercina L-15889 TaxID=1314783 RepID=A0A165TLM1_9APHY|nr:hypothetical protein DAEQUDRAFT_683936 [Daedalea quercina L-15889]
MWRWCQRNVRDVVNVARIAIELRTSSISHNLHAFLDGGHRHFRFARVALNASSAEAPNSGPKTLKARSPFGEQTDTVSPVTPLKATRLIPLHTGSSARAALAEPASSDGAYPEGGRQRYDPNSLHDSAAATLVDARTPPVTVHTPDYYDPSRPSSIDRLRAFLSTKHIDDNASLLTITRVRSLYHGIRAHEQHGTLFPHEYSKLIQLFGSLSLSTHTRPYRSVFGHSLAPLMTEDSYRPHWTMVERIASDKLKHGHQLDPSDRYWLMRMNLEALKMPEMNGGWRQATADQRLKWIEDHYSVLHQNPSVDIHVTYLEAMFSSHVALHLQRATGRMSELLTWYHGCSPSLLNLLWHVILQPPVAVQENLKAAVLGAIWCRLLHSSHGQNGPFANPLATPSNISDPTGLTDGRLACPLVPASSIDLVPFLRDALFFRPSARTGPASRDEISAWTLSSARKVFSPDHLDKDSLEHRWSCLLLLAVASSPGRTSSASVTSTYTKWGAVVDWQTICALASLQNTLRSTGRPLGFGVPFSNDAVQGLNGVLGALWGRWSSLPDLDHAARPRVVTRAICVSFVHLAGRFKNRRVVDACHQFCIARHLWNEEESGSPGLRSLTQEQLVALLLSGHNTEMAVSATLYCVEDEDLLSDIFSAAITAFAREDVALATELRSVARRVGVRLSTDSSVQLARCLAQHGSIASAKRYLSDAELSLDQRLTILHEILTQLVERGHGFRTVHFTSDLAGAMVKYFASTCPPATARSIIESTLLFMPRFQHSKAAVAVAEAIVQTDQSYFSPAFFESFVRNLLRHRQFRIARHVYELCQRLDISDKISSDWFIDQLSNHGASTLARNFARSQPPSISGISAVARIVKFREHPPPHVRTFRITKFLQHRLGQTQSGVAEHRALEVLIRAGRIRVVKKLYDQLRQSQSPSSRTAIGNSILHKSTQHRSLSQRHRGSKKAVRTLHELTERYAFLPDRVTINTMVKAYMQWTQGLTAKQLRALFDHFVRTGYPTGDTTASGVPFATAEGPPPVSLPKVDGPLSLVKHVKPLYKMFVKAFYRRGDANAAGVVIGILKAVDAEAEDLHDAWRRSRSRRTTRV